MSMARRRPAPEAPCATHPAPARALHHERHRPEQTTLYRLVQQHAASFIAHTEASTGAALPRFITEEFGAFLECGILAHGFPRLRCGECGHDKLLAFSCKRRGFCPSCGARRMPQTAAHLVDHCPCGAARPFARLKQSTGLFVSGLGLPHRLRPPCRAVGAHPARRNAA
jgi:hypothetical protein